MRMYLASKVLEKKKKETIAPSQWMECTSEISLTAPPLFDRDTSSPGINQR